MFFLNYAANKDMFKLNFKYLIIWLICSLRCIKFELNWIGIERKWIELELNWKIPNLIWIGIELNWKILNPAWIGIELNWKKWIDPSPELNHQSFLSTLFEPLISFLLNFLRFFVRENGLELEVFRSNYQFGHCHLWESLLVPRWWQPGIFLNGNFWFFTKFYLCVSNGWVTG